MCSSPDGNGSKCSALWSQVASQIVIELWLKCHEIVTNCYCIIYKLFQKFYCIYESDGPKCNEAFQKDWFNCN